MTLEWSLREKPSVPCGDPGTDPIRQDWLAGLAPAAFLTGCVCLIVAVRVSALQLGGRASVRPAVAAALLVGRPAGLA